MQPTDRQSRPGGAATTTRSHSRGILLVGQLTGRRGPAPGVPEERRTAADRRGHSLWSFVYGGVRPRRRHGRRVVDRNRGFRDWHEPRVLYLALGILLMSCADALFTLNLMAIGGEEVNVVMRSLLRDDVEPFLWGKIGVTAVSVILLVTAAHREVLGRIRVLTLLKAFCVGYALLIGYELYLLGWVATGVAEETSRELLRWALGAFN